MDDSAASERDDHALRAPVPAGALERSGRRRFRRAVTLLVLTLAAPGSAQYVAGNKRIGRFAMRCWLAVLATLVLLALITLVHSAFLVRLLSSSSVLTFIRALCIIGAIAWLGLFVDAWRLGGPRRLLRKHRIASTGLAAGFSIFTAATLLVSSQYVAVASTSLDSIFTSHVVTKPHEGRFNVMLLGGDAGSDRVGLRPDSVTVASIDDQTGATVLFSLPRNLQKVPFAPGSVMNQQFPRGFDCGTDCLLNAVYTWGSEHKNLWPAGTDAGLDATRSAVEGITGLRVNYYALVDMSGFADLINAVGGVNVNVKHALPIGPKNAPTSWITTRRASPQRPGSALVRQVAGEHQRLRPGGPAEVRDVGDARATRPQDRAAQVPEDRPGRHPDRLDRHPGERALDVPHPRPEGQGAEDPQRGVRAAARRDRAPELPGHPGQGSQQHRRLQGKPARPR